MFSLLKISVCHRCPEISVVKRLVITDLLCWQLGAVTGPRLMMTQGEQAEGTTVLLSWCPGRRPQHGCAVV